MPLVAISDVFIQFDASDDVIIGKDVSENRSEDIEITVAIDVDDRGVSGNGNIGN